MCRMGNNEKTDGKNTAYFRGRKLQGREVRLPRGYIGVVLAPKAASSYQKICDEEDRIEETISEEAAQFDGVMVWDHGESPDGLSDPYLRGVEEWISFADTVWKLILYVLRHKTDPNRYTRFQKRRKSSRGKCMELKLLAVGRNVLGLRSFGFQEMACPTLYLPFQKVLEQNISKLFQQNRSHNAALRVIL